MICLFIEVVLSCEFAIGSFLLGLNNKIYGIRNSFELTGYDLRVCFGSGHIRVG